MPKKSQNILVTGGAGFIGSMVVPALVARGHKITVIDRLDFGNNIQGVMSKIKFIQGDAFDITPNELENVDIIIHLAGLSNDPMADFRPRDNFIQNTGLTAHVVHLAKKYKIPRFIFASTQSVYGISSQEDTKETDPLNASFPYGLSKIQGELIVNHAASENFRPVILRQSTICGWAPRVRLDLVVNTMTKNGVINKKIVVGNPHVWRPLIHIRDLVPVYIKAVEDVSIAGTFNVSTGNYTLPQIASQVQTALKKKGIEVDIEINNNPDPRSYRMNADLAIKHLGLKKKFEIQDAVFELLDNLGGPKSKEWHNKAYVNFEMYKKKFL